MSSLQTSSFVGVRLYSSLMLILTTQVLSLGQIHEYVMSQFPRSTITDIEVVGNRTFVSAGLHSCATPSLLVFDSSTQLIDQKNFIFDPMHYYGKVSDIYHDSTAGLLRLLGWSTYADDVAGSVQAFIASFDSDLTLIDTVTIEVSECCDISKMMTIDTQLIAFSLGRQIHFVDLARDSTWSFDLSQYYPWNHAKAHYDGHNIVTYSDDSDNNILLLFTLQGDSITRIALDHAITQSMVLGNHFYAISPDKTFTQYDVQTFELLKVLDYSEVDFTDWKLYSRDGRILVVTEFDQDIILDLYDEHLDKLSSTQIPTQGSEKMLAIALNDHQASYVTNFLAGDLLMPVIRSANLQEHNVIARPDIALSELSILESFEIDSCFGDMYPECHTKYLIPSVFSATITNTGTIPITNFEFYSERLGGQNCAEGRYRKSFDTILNPGEEIQLIDSIYPNPIYSSPVNIVDFFVASPNHLIDEISQNNSSSGDLFLYHKETAKPIDVNIYPNPSGNWIYLDVPGDLVPSTVRVISANGISMHLPENKLYDKIDISTLPNGLYTLHIIDDQKYIYVGKFIKMD